MRKSLSWVAVAATASLLAACATHHEPNPQLEQARAVATAAATNPEVVKYAPLESKAATDTVNEAEKIWRDGGNEQEVDHLAYLATQRAHIAESMAQARAAEEQTSQVRTQADQQRLQTRTQQLHTAHQQTAALHDQIAQLQATPTDHGLLVTLGDVLFKTGQSDLLPTAENRIVTLANFLQQHPERRVRIEGYTDSVGSASSNQALSERRAMSVERALVRHGISPSRLSTRGYGEQYPMASNDTVEGRALNRRVEIQISDEHGVLPTPR